jgi:hypothetical protein
MLDRARVHRSLGRPRGGLLSQLAIFEEVQNKIRLY